MIDAAFVDAVAIPSVQEGAELHVLLRLETTTCRPSAMQEGMHHFGCDFVYSSALPGNSFVHRRIHTFSRHRNSTHNTYLIGHIGGCHAQDRDRVPGS